MTFIYKEEQWMIEQYDAFAIRLEQLHKGELLLDKKD